MKSSEVFCKVILLLCVMTLLMFPAQALAKDGWYMGMDLGFTMAPEMDVAGRDNDVATMCDRIIDMNASCTRTGNEGDSWMNPVDGGTGILAGFSLGYRLGAFRGEGEYFYRTATHDSRSLTQVTDENLRRKFIDELDNVDGGVDDVLSHNFFANLYYDFNMNSRFTPYIGVGVGVAQVSMDYFKRWQRSPDPRCISTFPDGGTGCNAMNAADPRNEKLAGTTTIADRKLTDTLFGYQLLAGMDYQISDPLSIGLKFRWADFGEFEGGAEWDQLRSHDSHNGDGVRVRYKVMTDDIQFWGLSLNMKYAFDQNVLSSSQAGVGAGLSNVADSSRTGSAKNGWYMGMDLGFAKAPDLKVDGGDNDVATTCDEFFVGDFSQDQIPRPSADCNPSSPSSFWNEVDAGTGILAGAALGYRLGDFRIEGEYFYRTTTHDGRSNTQGLDPITERKRGQELEILDGGVDDVLSHNFFANLYYDFHSNSRFTPYIGVGVGVAQVSMDFFSRWQRNGDPNKIETFKSFNTLTSNQKDALHGRLAGTTTIADRKLTDTLFGYQALAGVDYRVSDPVSIGLKFRWADFGEFKDEAEWDQLRSHDSARAPGGTRVRYFAMTDDIQFWGLSLNMKYAF